MRPHRLEIDGFGPFANRCEIDFDALSHLDLYLIVGRTGAGKTSIFDAMTYALYGKVSGARATGNLQSDHTGANKGCVALEFSHRDRRYRIERHLDGLPSHQVLVEIDGAGRETRETGARVLNDRIASLLGLDADQFMQVVLLPQGEFQRFLLAKTADRRGVLQAIFGTHLYERVADGLRTRVSRESAALTDARMTIGRLRDLATSAMQSLKDLDLDLGEVDIDGDAAGATVHLASVLESCRIRREAAREEETALAKRAERAELDAERFDARHELDQLRREVRRAARDVADAEVRLALHEEAEPLIAAWREVERVRDELRDRKRDEIEARGLLGAELRTAKRAPLFAALSDARDQPASDLRALHARLEKVVQELVESERETVTVSRELAHATAHARRLRRELGMVDASLAREEPSLALHRTTLKKLTPIARTLQKRDRELGRLEAQLEAKRRVAEMAREITAHERTRANAERTRRTALKTIDAAEARRLKAMAGEVATSLEEGKPCAVCGSTHHPRPARPARPTDLRSARAREQGAIKSIAAADEALRRLRRDLAAAEKTAAGIPSAARQRKLRSDHAAARDAATKVEQLSDDVEELQQSVQDSQRARARLVPELAAAERESTRLATHVTQLTASLKAGAGTVTAVVLVRQVREIGRLIDQTERAATSASRASVKEATTASAWERSLAASSFRSPPAVSNARLASAERKRLVEVITRAKERERRMTTLTGAIGSRPTPKIRPDVNAAARELERAASIGRQVSAQYAAVEQAHRHARHYARELKTYERVSRDREEFVAQLEQISRVVSHGSGSADSPLPSLEDWVLRSFFAEVCEEANVQLGGLLDGRYRLTLQADGAERSRAGSLDLYVGDVYTGTTRSVVGLSGGERFVVSLALALALASVVQHHYGGIELPALFIDEGFGHLDAETLLQTIDVLRSLARHGRSVGVVTHVEQMRQELPAAIEVVKSDRGSHVQMLDLARI